MVEQQWITNSFCLIIDQPMQEKVINDMFCYSTFLLIFF